MIDLISLVVTLIIMSLFGIGLILALIIMSQEKTELEQVYEEEAQLQYIHDYKVKKQKKKQARKKFINNLKNRIKKIFTRR